MKFNKITLKVVFSFLFLVFFTHVSIFFIMRTIKIDEAKKIHKYYKEISISALTEMFKNSFHPYSSDEIKNNRYYLDVLKQITEKHNLKAIIMDNSNHILLHSFDDGIPDNYISQIDQIKNEVDDLRNPFPLSIPYQTANKDRIRIILFNSYDMNSSDLLFNTLLLLLFASNLVLLLFISRWLTKPVRKFIEAIKSISDGDYSTNIEINSHDEFEDLADTINSMAYRIKQVISEQKEVSASISHELRSPLTRIKLALQILRDMIGDCKEKKLELYFDTIDKDIDGMDSLIDGILKLYRIDSDCSCTKHKIDLINLLEEELLLQKTFFDHLKIKIIKNYQIESHTINISPAIKTVFSNIIGNAAKYTVPDGFLEITIKEQHNELNISFENVIPCDSEIDIDKIVVPFYRGKNALDIKGNGMGLAISKRIIEMNNSKINFLIDKDIFKVIISLKDNL